MPMPPFLHIMDQTAGSSSTMELDDSLSFAPTDEQVNDLVGLLGPNSVKFS